ncbi:MAG: hypothetical protein KDK24_10050 [Pseudooceanicola sp.]|nr:hypothetical protein [Pseudooceanicola sp.]
MTPLNWTPGDTDSATWKKLERHIGERIADLQGTLERAAEPRAIHLAQGQIRALRDLIEATARVPRG